MENERYHGTETEKRELVVDQTLGALEEFCAKYGLGLEPSILKEFQNALARKGGYFQWTPSIPAFKRITMSSPSEFTKELGWDGRLAVVIENGDEFSEELTEELNHVIREATGNQWLQDPAL
jgi:hypothetical protein